jgi:hypothetical protein
MDIRKIVGDTLNTAEEIRKALRQIYPDVDDDEFENNRLWEDGKYKSASWSSGNLLPRNQHQESEFRDHLLHLNLESHPRVNAALEIVGPLRQARDQRRAALKDSCFGNGHVGKAIDTFRNRRLVRVQRSDESAAELLYLGKGVRFPALINHRKRGPLFYRECVRLEIPLRIRSSCGGFGKQILERSGKSEGDVLAEVLAERGIKGCWVALIEGHNLRNWGGAVRLDRTTKG